MVRFSGGRFGHCNLTTAQLAGTALQNVAVRVVSELVYTHWDRTFANYALDEAGFQNPRLAGTDFRTATGFIIGSGRNPLARARCTLAGRPDVVARDNRVVA